MRRMFFFKQKTSYEVRISDWSSDVCSSDLPSTLLRKVLPPGTKRRVSGSYSTQKLERLRPALTSSLWAWLTLVPRMTIAVSRVESKASDHEASGAPAQPASSDNNSITGATIRFSVSALPTIFIRRLYIG